MTIRRAAAWAVASQYVSFAIQFATSVIVSRFYLLPTDVGLFSIALAAAMVLAIFQDMGFSRFITGQPEMRPEHLRDYAAVALGAGALVAAALALGAIPLAEVYAQPALAALVWIVAAAFAVQAFGIVPLALLTRDMDFRTLFFANAGSALAGGIVSVLLAAQQAGPAALAWGMLATAVTRAGLALSRHPVFPRRPRALGPVRPMMTFGSSSFFISLSGAIGMRSQDLIVGRLLGIAATGLFSRASSLAGQLSMLMVGAINAVFYPAFAKKRDEGARLDEPYLHLIACNTALNWAAALGLALAAEPLVHLLYGPNWSEVAPLLFWIAIAEALFIAVPLHMDIPILLGRIRSLVWINLADTTMTIAILALACLWGLEAAAMSRLVAATVWFAIYATFIAFLLKLRVTALATIYLRSAVCAAAAGAPMLVAHWLGRFGPETGFAELLGLALAGAICWLAALALVRHPLWGEVQRFAAHLARQRRLRPIG
jgi:O-antigen/teichoic acid export membrane protein